MTGRQTIALKKNLTKTITTPNNYQVIKKKELKHCIIMPECVIIIDKLTEVDNPTLGTKL